MSDSNTVETATTETETGTEETTQKLPDDHPLVKTLAAQRSELKDLRAKAARLTQIEESQKSEAEKVADRITKADAEVASVPAKVSEALKAHLVELHSIDAEDADLFLTATEPDLLVKQVTRLLGQSDAKRRKSNVVPNEGKNPNAAPSTDTAFARDLLGG